ncbi:MAG: hypothetical protein ACYTFK_14755 [Planctomycetota bacterium]|jgi:hypothetical protein
MAKKRGFNSSKDVLDFAYTSLERLRQGKSSVDQVRVEAAQIGNVAKILHERITFAKLAGLIEKGKNVLPNTEFE